MNVLEPLREPLPLTALGQLSPVSTPTDQLTRTTISADTDTELCTESTDMEHTDAKPQSYMQQKTP